MKWRSCKISLAVKCTFKLPSIVNDEEFLRYDDFTFTSKQQVFFNGELDKSLRNKINSSIEEILHKFENLTNLEGSGWVLDNFSHITINASRTSSLLIGGTLKNF